MQEHPVRFFRCVSSQRSRNLTGADAMHSMQVMSGGVLQAPKARFCPHSTQRHIRFERVLPAPRVAAPHSRSLSRKANRSAKHLSIQASLGGLKSGNWSIRRASLGTGLPCKYSILGSTKQPFRRSCQQRIHLFGSRRCAVKATMLEEETAVETTTSHQSMEVVLAQQIAENTELVRGRLSNGLEYVILPNETPPSRFEAHLEVHAGSVDENEDEQGIAHIVEHVTFLGSNKRDQLLGTGARSNAYTDFHHTVFHVHSPLVNTNVRNSGPMLPQVLSTLAEVAFQPEFLTSRIEKERKAVLAEAQMMNTIEYRVDCALLKYLHHENALGCRFPIGQTSQVEQWNRDQIVRFWQRWYFPANTTLYLVGDFGQSVEECKKLIERSFGGVPAVRHGQELSPHTFGRPLQSSNGHASSSSAESPLKTRHEVRPPVEHVFGCGPLSQDFQPAKVEVFQHRLLQYFMLSIFCKLPVQTITTVGDLRRSSMSRILLSVLSFRLNQRYVEGNPPFIAIDIDISDSAREGCVVSTLTITSEPKDWRGAVQVAIQEVRRLQRYGVTKPEMERYQAALLRDAEQAAEQSTSIPSLEMLEYSMDSIGLDHTVMDQAQTFKMLQNWVGTITVEDINKEAASLFSFASHYGTEAEALEEAEQDPERFAAPGPTRTTAIVACYPAFTDPRGESIGGAAPIQRGASMTTDKHVDPSVAPKIIEEENQPVHADVPEGALPFKLTAEEIQEAMMESSIEVEAPADIDVPDSLLPEPELQQLIVERNPHFVPVPGMPEGTSPLTKPDPVTGIVQRQLSNGIKVNYWYSDNEPGSVVIRVCAAGGRALEGMGPGSSGCGSVLVGTRSLSESGTVGTWQREQVELFCISRLLNVVLENDEEFVYMDCSCPVGNGSLVSMMELLHNFLERPRWEENAMNRAKQMFLSHYKSLHKSLERETGDRIMGAMFGPTRRLRDPAPEDIEALTLEGMREVLDAQLHAGNIEVNIVGDFKAEELDDLLVKYLGTIRPLSSPSSRVEDPIEIRFPERGIRQQVWHLKDSDERAAAYVAGKAPPRWGHFHIDDLPPRDPSRMILAPQVITPQQHPREAEHQNLIRRSHPLYGTTTLRLLTEIMNGRLFTTVRDSLGLTYDVSFELSQFDRLRLGYFVIHVTSTPAKIRDALAASVDVLRSFHVSPVNQRELVRAQRTLLTRHESDLKTNVYRLGLITHLQADAVPLKSVQCLRDLQRMYEAATVDDVMQAYHEIPVDDDHIFTCIGTSGPNPLPGPTSAMAEAELAGTQVQNQGNSPTQKAENVNAFAALLSAIQASKQSQDIAKAMQSLKEERNRKNSA